MYLHIFDLATLSPAAVLTNITDGVCEMMHNESGQGTFTVLAESKEVLPLVTDETGRFDLDKMLQASLLWMAHVYDNLGVLRMQGRITIQPAETDAFYTITVNDLLDELRLIPLPPLRVFNNTVVNILNEILAAMPPASRRREMARPSVKYLSDEQWALGDVSEAINAWTTLDASRMSCLEAAISVCEATGNSFRLASDRSRSIDVYEDPDGSNRPRVNIMPGSYHTTEPAERNMTIVGAPTMTIENDTIIAGAIPEGGSYQTEDNISKVVRLQGTEEVPDGYRLENWNGYWGVFNEDLVSSPVTAGLPGGQLRCEVFGNILPLINTDESVSSLLTAVNGTVLTAAAFDGYEPDHWKDGTASYGEESRKITGSSGATIILESGMDVAVGETVDVSVFRKWDEDKVTDSQQSLAGAAVAYLDSNRRVMVSWSVRVPNTYELHLGEWVRLIYSGGIQVRHWQSGVVRYLPTVTISEVLVISRLSVIEESGIEYLELTLTDSLWRFPSSSGLREIMAIIQRRIPGARMGREGAAYTEQYILTTTVNPACSLGYRATHTFSPPFYTAPSIVSASAVRGGAVVETTITATTLTVCANAATTVRVTIVPTERNV